MIDSAKNIIEREENSKIKAKCASNCDEMSHDACKKDGCTGETFRKAVRRTCYAFKNLDLTLKKETNISILFSFSWCRIQVLLVQFKSPSVCR